MDNLITFDEFVTRLNDQLRSTYAEIPPHEWIFSRNADGAAWIVGRARFSCNRREAGRTAIIGRSESDNIPARQMIPTDVDLTEEGVQRAVKFAQYLSPKSTESEQV